MPSSFSARLDQLKKQGLYRQLRMVEEISPGKVTVDGREALLLCSNNYLGLADHPALKRAAQRAIERWGTSSGASRLVSGTMPLHDYLEERIASFKGTEAALAFNSGYAANTGIIEALAGRGDSIFSDKLNHASIVDGARLSQATLIRYPHNDPAALRHALERHPTQGLKLIVTDGVFSMDGDMARLAELVSLKKEFGALLMVDDAHGVGVLGASGRGCAEIFDVQNEIDIQMGTLGKGLGSFGAYAAASRDIINWLINKARSFIFSTSLPPAVLAASLAAFDLVESSEGAELRHKLADNTHFFRESLQASGFDTMGSTTQIVPVLVGDASLTMTFSKLLLEQGLYVQGIRPPTVPAGKCRLRCTLMSTHTREMLEQAVETICHVGKSLGVVHQDA
jgi:8-amino-7-oxononanoate synthase